MSFKKVSLKLNELYINQKHNKNLKFKMLLNYIEFKCN